MFGYIGLWAPRDTPKEVLARLYDSVKEALTRPNMRELFATLGAATDPTPPESLRASWNAISPPSSVGRANSAPSQNSGVRLSSASIQPVA